jgi:uncharacterized damage-inducible protein DinB
MPPFVLVSRGYSLGQSGPASLADYNIVSNNRTAIRHMTSPETARMLMRYNAWANRTLFDAVAALPAGEATKERPTLFKNMVNTLNHLYVVDLIWRAHLEGREHGIPALNTVLHADLAALWKAQQDIDAWYVAWADALSETQARETVRFTLIGGNRGEMQRGDIALHVVNHTSYHRGFVADMFYQIPLRPPTTDLPVFLRETASSGRR